MVAEYKRWGFASKRYLIAYSQIFASVGLILGFYNSIVNHHFLIFVVFNDDWSDDYQNPCQRFIF